MSDSIVFVAAKRTPFGSFGGSLKERSATDLAVHASQAAIEAGSIPVERIEHVVFGNVMQTSGDAAYLARHVGLKCGLPLTVPALTLNRLCGSGFEAVVQAAHWIQLGRADVVLAGGTESMSQAPYVSRGARWGLRLGNQEWEDTLMQGLYDSYAKMPMAITAENLAAKYQLTREQCDAFALQSQQRAAEATEKGWLSEEMAPLTVTHRKGETVVERDEHIRPEANEAALAKLKPVFKKDGVVTAGNASGMVDGAAALILTRRSIAKKEGWNILGEFVESAVVGCDPTIMGIGPVPACRRLMETTKTDLNSIRRFEVNEAFAPQYLAVEKELGLDREKTNTNGGAIAIGHPLGGTGARITAHLLHDLRRLGGGTAMASACIGGGQGIALMIRV